MQGERAAATRREFIGHVIQTRRSSIGGSSPVPLRNLELAARDPDGHRERPAAGMISLAATGWQVAGATPDAAGHAAGSHRQATPGPGRWPVFG